MRLLRSLRFWWEHRRDIELLLDTTVVFVVADIDKSVGKLVYRTVVNDSLQAVINRRTHVAVVGPYHVSNALFSHVQGDTLYAVKMMR